jgi:5-methylthioribose kinase
LIIDFFILERLEPLVKIAYNKRLIDNKLNKQFNILYSKLNSLIPQECPSLIHGDLWSGNFISDENGEVCIIDPAVYYGHREAEIAFTKMFGGFSHSFYEYYNDYFPLEKDWQKRIDLFNLYPALVHLILFAPHFAEELWNKAGHTTSIHLEQFPKFNAKYIIEDTFQCPISFNGKMRFTMQLSSSATQDEITQTVLQVEETQKWLDGKTPKKVIVIPKKIVNIVI